MSSTDEVVRVKYVPMYNASGDEKPVGVIRVKVVKRK